MHPSTRNRPRSWRALVAGLALFLALPFASAAVAQPAGETPPWLKDCAAQILARVVMEEARARVRASGGQDPDPRPTVADLRRAQARVLATLDELMLLSGLDPRPFRQARAHPAPLRRAVTGPRRRPLASDIERF